VNVGVAGKSDLAGDRMPEDQGGEIKETTLEGGEKKKGEAKKRTWGGESSPFYRRSSSKGGLDPRTRD